MIKDFVVFIIVLSFDLVNFSVSIQLLITGICLIWFLFFNSLSRLSLAQFEEHQIYSYASTSLIVSLAALRAGMILAKMDKTITTASHRKIPSGVNFNDNVEPIIDSPIIFNSRELIARVASGMRILKLEEQLMQAHQQMEFLAMRDGLTGLLNRRAIEEYAEAEFNLTLRKERALSVIMLDIDHFKSVNDTLGHPIGDTLLKLVADRLRGCTREPDTIARLGGDEFAIIMTQLQEPNDATALARRIRDSIVKPYQIDGHQIISDISIGISIAPIDGTEPDRLLKNADLALYGAKSDGRGTYRFFEQEMDTRMKARRDLEMDLRNALAHSGSSIIQIDLTGLGSELVMTVADKGRGFTVAEQRMGLGLSGMAERMRNINGVFNINSVPGAGTTVTASAPLVEQYNRLPVPDPSCEMAPGA
jgi:diguanylate cyclase (GGDEF)-like protein